MGEAPKLDLSESLRVVKTVNSVSQLPMVVGVSSPGLGPMKALAQEAMSLGASAVLVAPLRTLRTDDDIVGYFRTVAEALGPDVPIVLQDYPLRFSVVISITVMKRILESVPSVIAIKHEDWPGLEKVSRVREFARQTGRRLSIMCGNGGLFLDFELDRAADGAMTGYCFPELLVRLTQMAREDGQRDAMHDLFDIHLPLIRYEQQSGVGLAVRKYVMARRGLLKTDAQRRPSRTLSAREKDDVDYLLDRIGSRDKVCRIG